MQFDRDTVGRLSQSEVQAMAGLADERPVGVSQLDRRSVGERAQVDTVGLAALLSAASDRAFDAVDAELLQGEGVGRRAVQFACWRDVPDGVDAGLILVNWLRTVRLSWIDVERCGHDSDGVWVRAAGGELRASAFQHGHRALAFARQPAQEAAARLESLRKRR